MPENGTNDAGELARFSEVLGTASETLEAAEIPHAVFGGVAAALHGRPGGRHDIDVLVRPPDARRALEALAEAGFETEEASPRWLYKAFLHDVMVDVIFRVKGDVFLDDEMVERSVLEERDGRKVRVVAPEDSVVMEALSHGDDRPEHWYNALAILAERDLDWEYLLRRARHGSRRVLSLLIYAQSNDLVVPDDVIRALFDGLYMKGGTG